MEKEPWEEDVYDNGEDKLKRTKKFMRLECRPLIDHINHYFLYFSGCGGMLPDLSVYWRK